MKTFRTVFPPQQAPFSLTHDDRLLLIGSCFTEHIGLRLAAGKFSTCLNPNGIVYNPVSIARLLEQLLLWGEFSIRSEDERIENALHCHNGLWHSWEHHGHFSKPDRAETLRGIREAREEAAISLQKTGCVLLTLGTAEVFALKETGQIVANCHKAPASCFDQRRLSVAETVEALGTVLEKLKNRQPSIRVVLTVSPVRHLRNGLVENQRSKAVLVLACAELCTQLDFACYFPAYELLLDDLRDYRFYAADMTHPNDQAIDYIWSYFSGAFFSTETQRLLEQIEKIAAAVRHRPFHPDTAEHRAFALSQLEKIAALSGTFPGFDFEAEQQYFEQFIQPTPS